LKLLVLLCSVRFSEHPPGRGAANQAITAIVLSERLAAGYGEDDPFVLGWRDELGL
jgi:hypothetical protein